MNTTTIKKEQLEEILKEIEHHTLKEKEYKLHLKIVESLNQNFNKKNSKYVKNIKAIHDLLSKFDVDIRTKHEINYHLKEITRLYFNSENIIMKNLINLLINN